MQNSSVWRHTAATLEEQIVKLLLCGKMNNEIASALCLSEKRAKAI